MDIQLFYYVAALLLVLVGLAGIVLPALPGVPLMFLGMLLAAWAGGFAKIGTTALAVLGGLTVLSLIVDLWAAALGAKRVGASRKALAGAVIGTFAGLFFGPAGLFAGPFFGALLGELWANGGIDRARLGQATRVGAGTWLGIALGIALKLMLACAMLGVFALAWFT